MPVTITETSEYIDLVAKANAYTRLYDLGTPAISDKQWDDLYFAIADFVDGEEPYNNSGTWSFLKIETSKGSIWQGDG